MAFAQQPTIRQRGDWAVTVQLLDPFGNLTTSAASVTVAIGTNPGSGTLSGTKIVAASSGVATFGTLSIDKAAAGYTLTASSTGLTGMASFSFNITAAAASKLVVTTAPQTTVAGVSSGIITVQRLDQFGNAVTAEANRTITLSTTATTSGMFRDTGDSGPILTVTINSGSSTASFLYRDTVTGTPTITSASTAPTTITSLTQVTTAIAAAFTKLQTLLPGETAAPGTPTGKMGTPNVQTAGSVFTVTVNAVDANWNLVSTITDTVQITSADNNASLPNAALVAERRL
jgi:hypothetical protein